MDNNINNDKDSRDDVRPDDLNEESAGAAEESAAENGDEKSGDEEKSSFSAEFEEKAGKVLRAVDTILDSNDKIRSVCKKMKRQVLFDDDEEEDEKVIFMNVGKRIVSYYSDRAGISGGMAGLPSMIPGIGIAIGLVGASAVDIVLMLKFEIEMSLCLCHLAGFDIDDERDRQLAYTLATVSSYDIMTNHDQAAASKSIIGAAFWDYSLRELSKHMIAMIAGILCMHFSKGLVRALPFVGVVVGASFNKIMTKRAGICCLDALWLRRHLISKGHSEDKDDPVYDAEILD